MTKQNVKKEGLYAYMDCSMEHLDKGAREYIDYHKTDDQDCPFVIYPYDYGVWLFVGSDRANIMNTIENTEVPQTLRAIYAKAFLLDAMWIKLDWDAHVHEDLSVYTD